jgi:hypothetical protein
MDAFSHCFRNMAHVLNFNSVEINEKCKIDDGLLCNAIE